MWRFQENPLQVNIAEKKEEVPENEARDSQARFEGLKKDQMVAKNQEFPGISRPEFERIRKQKSFFPFWIDKIIINVQYLLQTEKFYHQVIKATVENTLRIVFLLYQVVSNLQ